MQGQCSSQAQMKQPKQSRSSVGQSATLIMQRSPVQIWTGLLRKQQVDSNQQIVNATNYQLLKKFLNYCNHYRWGVSSAGQSTCLARRGSSVRLRYPPLFSLKEELSSGDQDKGVMIVSRMQLIGQHKKGSSPYTSQQQLVDSYQQIVHVTNYYGLTTLY